MTHVLGLKLEEAGFDIEVVRNGLEALESVHEETTDVVATELQMPEMDGFYLSIVMLKERMIPGMPILLITGRGHITSPE